MKRNKESQNELCTKLLSDIQSDVLDLLFPKTDDKGDSLTPYQIGGYNLLKNDGRIFDYQQAHTDYANILP